MKKLIALTLCSIMAMNAGAERISRDEALALAQDFMQGKVMVPVQASSSKAPVRGSANDESYYIFNAADNGGYAIMAADDRVSPVLGFSDQGNINTDNMPDNMAAWLENYEQEIRSLKSNADIVSDTPISRSEVKPMLISSWDRYAPYNLLTPVYFGVRCPLSCDALALAQIMYYHKWPVGTVDSIPPYINTAFNDQLIEGLPATTFKWDIMKPSYDNSETDESAYAVAELLRYCEQAIETCYSPVISCSYKSGQQIIKELIERFNYSRQIEIVSKDYYTSNDWDELIYNELASGRPVFYCGGRTLDSYSSFVCDGYKDGYFHINWGVAGGYYDGYFKLSLLSMEEPGLNNQYNYGCGQNAIIGMEPEKNSLAEITFTDDCFKYTILSDTSVMIQALEDKEYYGIDTLWIPDHVDYNGKRYYVTRLGYSRNFHYHFKKVCLPSSLKQIDDNASFLQTILEFTIPSGIEVLSPAAFMYNDSLERFIAEDNSRYKVIDGVLFSHDGKTLICYPIGRKDTCYTVPDGVEIIESFSFSYNLFLSDLILPDCIEHINDKAFYSCCPLKKINLPDNLKDIGFRAFFGCINLSDIILPQKIGTIFEDAFRGCRSLKDIVLPNSQNNCLGVGTFQDCSSLESVYIPSGIEGIRSDCFNGCTALKEIIVESLVPPAVEYYSAFNDTVYENAVLKVPADAIELYKKSYVWYKFKNISAIPSYTINGINYILSESAKTAVVIPGKEPYSGGIVIPASVEHNGIEYTVNAMQPAAFAGCQDLTSVVIDAPVSVLPDSLFKDCSSLKSIKLNDGIIKIRHYVFYGCSALEAIEIPQGVASIGEYLFAECKSLRSVTFPESVRLLGPSAFLNCTNLDSVTICGFMHQLDVSVFYGCTNLTYVSLPKNLTRFLSRAFKDCSKLQTIIIPENVTTLFDYCFYNCTSLKSIVLPEDFAYIFQYCFGNCQSLESITIPANSKGFDKSAFEDCSNLTSFYCYVENPQKLYLGEDVFKNINENCILYVPQGCAQAYRDDGRWNAFSEIREIGVTEVEPVANEAAVPVEYYNLSGSKLPVPQQGINLIRYSDGTVRKVTQ